MPWVSSVSPVLCAVFRFDNVTSRCYMWLNDFCLGPFRVGIMFESHYFTFLQGGQRSGSFVVVAFLVLLLALAISGELRTTDDSWCVLCCAIGRAEQSRRMRACAGLTPSMGVFL